VLVACTDTLYALAAARASRLLKGPRTALWSRRASGGVLIAAGVATAAVQT
jgi:threonine/homoserine/homoserine lactone efflux protein